MKRNIEPYYVINWDPNRNRVEHYNIMPYLVEKYKALKKSRSKYKTVPKTFNEFKEFVFCESQYQFWSRCEYEVIVGSWPYHAKRDDNGNVKMASYTVYTPEARDIPTIDFYDQKIDVFEQISMNIDVITNHFIKQVQ